MWTQANVQVQSFFDRPFSGTAISAWIGLAKALCIVE
jgi:hypothetical protein